MKKSIIVLFSIFALLFGSTTTSLAVTIYLNSSTGNDATGNGTLGSPYKTFTKGYAMSNPGDILDLTGTFTWTDADETGDGATSGFTIAKNITIQGHVGQTIVQAASSAGTANCRVFTVDATNSVTFNNLEIRYGNPLHPADGGGMSFGSSATITISNCYIHHNTARQGVGIYIITATVGITNSTIANNNGTTLQASVNGGGVFLQGPLPLIITNTTICNNYIYGYGGGINTLSSSTTTLTNCTIVNNTSELDGGGISMGGPAGCAVQIKNTMVANNTSATVPVAADFDMFQGTLTDNGYNIVEVGTGTFTAPSDITGNQANLFGTGIGTTPALALNGSINGTPTLALGTGSVAINTGSTAANGSVSIPTTDQRGLSRVGATDIGTYEYGAAAANNAPTDIALSASSINENVAANTTVGTLSSTDPDAGNTFTYTLVAGTGSTDNASFNISGSSLRITNSPDFETKSSYSVRIRTTDQGALFYEKAFTITINDLNETPTDIALSGSSLNENVVANTTVGTLSSTDQDAANTFTYTLVAGTGSTDNASFNISGSSLRITNSPDFETKSSYSVRVRTTDQGTLFYEKAFTITIMNVNEAPTDIALSASSINENVVANSTVGTLSSTDPDVGNTFTYSLVVGTGDTDNASFNISGNSLRITNSPNFETKSSYSVRVRTTDQGSLTFEKAFTITINDLNETPTDISLSASSINENVVANSTIGTLSSTDQDAANTFTYTLVAGTGSTDNASFNISGSSLRITGSPDFETKNSYSIRVRTTDQGTLWFEKVFTITISDLNEAPTDISLSGSSISENVVANSTVGTLSSTDQDAANTFTYTLVAGTGSTDNASFNISGSSLRITNSPDFETKSSYSVRIRTTDQGTLFYEKAFTITITNLNETPTDIALSASSVNENVVANTTVGTLSTTDPDVGNTFTYALVVGTGDTDNAAFNISGSSLRITNSPDFETKSSYSVRVRTTDQGSLTFEKAFTITINDLNETPTDIVLSASSVNENVVANTTVGSLSSTDPDAGNLFNYTLVSGTGSTDNASFNISGGGLRITNSPDFETKNSYSVRLRTTDQGGLYYEKAFTITILDVNEAPTDIALSATSINENVAANSTVGAFSSTDPDAGNTFTYSLEAGIGDTDNASFNISGNSLRITNSPNYELKNSYSVRVRTTDQGGLWFEEVFVISIIDIDEPAVVTTQAVSNISTVMATGNGTITDLGSPNPTSHGVCWNTTGAPTTADFIANLGAVSTAGAFNVTMPGLSANTTYYVKAFATNTSGTSYGDEVIFTSGKIQLTITDPTLTSKEYDGSMDASSVTTLGTVSGVVGSDDVTVAIATSTFDTKNVGTGKTVTVTYSISGADIAYYLEPVASTVTTGEITTKAITITGLVAANKEYDGNTDAVISGGALQGVVIPDVVTATMPTTGTFASKDVNTGIAVTLANITLSGADLSNYTLTQPTGLTADITAKELTITGLVASNKEYDGNTDAIVSGGTLQGVVIPDIVTATMPTTGTFASKDVNTGIAVTLANIALSGADISNYTLTQPSGLSANITAKELAIGGSFTVSDKEYDGTTAATIVTNNLTLTGVVPSETVVLNPVAEFASAAIANNILVTLTAATTISGADFGNYTLSLVGSPTTTASITPVTAINEISNGSFNIYPNPFTDHIYFSTTENVSKVSVTNIAGELLFEKVMNGEAVINTNDLSRGVYFITVEMNSKEKLVYKMVK